MRVCTLDTRQVQVKPYVSHCRVLEGLTYEGGR